MSASRIYHLPLAEQVVTDTLWALKQFAELAQQAADRDPDDAKLASEARRADRTYKRVREARRTAPMTIVGH